MIYTTADLHGCSLGVLQRLLRQVHFTDEDFLFVLGDVIDRGEHGAELLMWLTEQPNVQLILGNHEALLLACDFLFEEVSDDSLARLNMENMALLENWMQNGGGPTIRGLQKLMKRTPELVEGILDYLRDAPLYEEVWVDRHRYVLVHSGLGNFDPKRELSGYGPEELLMERPAMDTRYFGGNTTVVFGHTPTFLYGEEHRGKMVKTDTWRCIDTGTAEGNPPMLLCLNDGRAHYLQCT